LVGQATGFADFLEAFAAWAFAEEALVVVEAWVAAASFAAEEALSRQCLLVLFAEK
jgi:hypothetical protein